MTSPRPAGAPARDPGRPRRPWDCWRIGLPALILLGPLLSFLTHHNYGLLRVEAIGWYVVLIGLGCLLGLVLLRAPAALRVLILTACLTIFVDVQFDGAHAIGARKLALIAIGIAIVVWFLRARIEPILAVGFATLVVSIIALPDRIPSIRMTGDDAVAIAGGEDRAPVILLILDEHIGIDGIPQEATGGPAAREGLLEMYSRYGFRVYGRAYSQYFDTHNAIPNQLNFVASQIDNAYFETAVEPRNLRRNDFFAGLVDAGYALRIYQSDYMNLCGAENAETEYCLTYRRNSIQSVEDLEIPAWEKLKFIGSSLFYRSAAVFRAKRLYNAVVRLGLPFPELGEGVRRVGPLPTQVALDRMNEDILAAPESRLFLAHLMAPHYPYVYDARCRTKTRLSGWLRRTDDRLGPEGTGRNTEESRLRRYEAYLDQVACTRTRVESFLASLDSAGILERATVIIQGDHGSRINLHDPRVESLDSMVHEDYVDGFSALFAARMPGLEAGYDGQSISLVRAFTRTFGRDEGAIETDEILLAERGSTRLTAVPMPPF